MSDDTEIAASECCDVHKLGKCDAVFTCCDKCPTFFGKPGTAATTVTIPEDQAS